MTLETETNVVSRIRGVVKPGGTGASQCEDKTWNVQFTLAAWRIVGGPLMRAPLYLRYNQPDEDALGAAYKLVPDDAVVVVRCASLQPFGPEVRAHRGDALAIESPGPDDDADQELHALAVELARPVLRSHPFFGEMPYNRARNWFEARRSIAGEIYSVSITAAVDQDLTPAEEAVRHLESRLPQVAAQVARMMLPLYNDNWREDDAPVESEASFAVRLGVPSVVVDCDDGDTTLYFDDDDLFAGHAIQASLDEAGEVADATLVG
jgi:hypothetical protein